MLRIRLLILLGVFMLIAGQAAAQDALIPAGEKVLAWIGNGAVATEPVGTTELVFINGDGSTEPVLTLPANTQKVIPCGDNATSPSGRQFAFYAGGDRGALYMMNDASAQLQTISDNVSDMTCAGAGTFVYSPNGAIFAYLDYEVKYNTEISFTGTLVLRDSPTFGTLTSFEETAAFDLTDNGLAFIEFLKNDDDEATEAIVRFWDGSSERDITSKEADEDCYFVNGNIEQMADGRMTVVLGYRCTVGETRTSWQLYTVDTNNRSMTLVMSNVSEGRYVPVSRTNAMYQSPDGANLFFAIPDGFTAYSSTIVAADLAQGGVSPVIANNALMPNVTARPYAYENHMPVVSPDGKLLAIVRNDVNNQATLSVIDLANRGVPPIEIAMKERGEIVSELIFAPDSSVLYYVAGGENSALYALDMLSGSENRISRGRLAQGVLSPDGTKIALVKREIGGERETPYITVVTQNIASGSEAVIFTGGEVIENRVANQRFAYPLAWRRSA